MFFFGLFSVSYHWSTSQKRREYDPDQISLALQDGMSVYKAARMSGIPESTLRDRHLGLQSSVENLPTHGPDPLLKR